jgi:hypothetical protein
MNAQAQTVTIRGQKKAFAVRFLFPVDSEPQPIKPSAGIAIMPEFGGIMYNIELYDGFAVKCYPLKKPVEVGSIKARLRAEVWQAHKGERKRLYQEWFAAKVPEGYKTLTAFITEILTEESKKVPTPTRSEPPITVEKLQGPMDIRASQRKAGEKLLRQEFPRLFRARDNKLKPAEVCKAYIADLWALDGKPPSVAALEKFLADSGVTGWLSAALAKPGRKIESAEWALVLGWIREGYYAMEPDALCAALNERTGLKLSAEAWRKRADRLGLVNSRKLGRPEEHIFTMR